MASKLLKGKGKESGKGMSFTFNKDLLDMLSGFTILRVTTLTGAIGITFTKELLIAINAKLNKIKKTKKK